MSAAVAQRLRERADSYSRDVLVLEGTPGFKRLAVAYRTIAAELRKIAEEAETWPSH